MGLVRLGQSVIYKVSIHVCLDPVIQGYVLQTLFSSSAQSREAFGFPRGGNMSRLHSGLHRDHPVDRDSESGSWVSAVNFVPSLADLYSLIRELHRLPRNH